MVAELERRLTAASGRQRPLTDYFHLFSGTSTGGLIALGLTAAGPGGAPRMDGEKLVSLYRDEGPRIFGFGWQRIRSVGGWLGPRHSPRVLREVLADQLGPGRLRALAGARVRGAQPHARRRRAVHGGRPRRRDPTSGTARTTSACRRSCRRPGRSTTRPPTRSPSSRGRPRR